MKKNGFVPSILCVALLCTALSGCGAFSALIGNPPQSPASAQEYKEPVDPPVTDKPTRTPKNSAQEASQDEESTSQSEALQGFTALSQKSGVLPKELIVYIRSNIGKMNEGEPAIVSNEFAVHVVNYFISKNKEFQELQGSNDDLYNLQDVSYSSENRIENESIPVDLAAHLNELIDNNLMFYFAEGLVLDYDAQAYVNLFGNDVKSEAIDFMQIFLAEQKQPSMLEGMVQIEKKDMIARYDAVKRFIDSYPTYEYLNQIEAIRLSYLKTILVQDWGLFDYDTGEVREEARVVLNDYVAASKGTLLEPIIAQYTALLEKEGWKKTQAVTVYLKDQGIEDIF